MKYRKKPVVVEAFQWTADRDQSEDPDWIIEAGRQGVIRYVDPGSAYVRMRINTPEGRMYALLGDYIIRGVKGELYPCKADIFEMTYEQVE